MLKLFQVCFVTGVLYTVISFILGHLLDFAGVGGHVDVDMGVDIDLDAGSGIDLHGVSDIHGINHGDMSGTTVSPLKPVTIAAFITVFEGTNKIERIVKNIKDLGKIHYSVGGNTYSAPAKSVDGNLIAKGAPVVIIEINKSTFYVKEVKGGFM